MRILITLSFALVFGMMAACDASGAADSKSSAQSETISQAQIAKQPAPEKPKTSADQTPVKRRVIPVREVQSPTQAAPNQLSSGKLSEISETPKLKVLPNWKMRPDESSIIFRGKQTGDEFSGEFKTFTADIVFNPDFIKAASVEAVIDMSSFDAGDKDRNDALPGKDWFAVKDFPKAVFKSDNFIDLGDNTYEAKGELTIRGVSLPVTLPFKLDLSEDRLARMSGTLEIDRSDFGVGQRAWAKGEWVDLNVGIDITIVADRLL